MLLNTRRSVPRLLLAIVVLMILSLATIHPAQALTGGLTYVSSLNITGSTCAGSSIGFTFTGTGQTADDSNNKADWGALVTIDGNGHILVVNGFAVGVGFTTPSINYSTPLDNITAGPITIEMVDIGLPIIFNNPGAADVVGKPVLASFTVDPATLFDACKNLAHGSFGTHCTFLDGRVNCFGTDAGQADAIYCTNGGVEIYAIYQGTGYFAFRVTKDELKALPDHPARNTLIKQGLGAQLYKLTSGELQVNGPDGYSYRWPGC